MATKFVLKRKTFDDSNKKSHIGRNIALGLGTAAATGLAFAGARRGMMGGRAQMATNRAWNRAGKALGSTGMQASAQKGYVSGYLEHNNLEANVKNLKKASDVARSKGLTSRKARDTGGYKGTKYEKRQTRKNYMTDKQVAQQEEALRQKRAADYAKSQERAAKAQQQSNKPAQQQSSKPAQQQSSKPAQQPKEGVKYNENDYATSRMDYGANKKYKEEQAQLADYFKEIDKKEKSVMANRRQPAYNYTPSSSMPGADMGSGYMKLPSNPLDNPLVQASRKQLGYKS